MSEISAIGINFSRFEGIFKIEKIQYIQIQSHVKVAPQLWDKIWKKKVRPKHMFIRKETPR